jgi:hypothetical protein
MAMAIRRVPIAATLAVVVVAWFLGSGCGTPKPPKKMPEHEWVTRHAKAERLNTPPNGKALLNLHRPGYIYQQFAYGVYTGEGRFLADVPIMAVAQCVVEPGEHVLIGWLMSMPVSVVRASVLADRVYDIWIEESPSITPRLVPLLKNDGRRAQLPEWEAAEDPVALKRLDRVVRSETNARAKIERVKQVFLGGPKSGRVMVLGEQDSR